MPVTKTKLYWAKLDYAAKNYAAARTKQWSNVFRLSVTLTEPVNLAQYPVIKVTGFALDGDNRYPQKLQLRDAPFGNVLAETVILNTTDANWGSETEPATATISAASGGYAYVVFENPRGIGGNLQWPFYISTIEYFKE